MRSLNNAVVIIEEFHQVFDEMNDYEISFADLHSILNRLL